MSRSRSKRRFPRFRFHPGRMPPVILKIDKRLITGYLRDYGQMGLGLCVRGTSLDLRVDLIVDELFIARIGEDYCIKNLRISYVDPIPDSDEWNVGVEFENPEDYGRRTLVMGLLLKRKLENSVSDQDFREDRMPGFQGPAHYQKAAVEQRIEWIERMSQNPVVAMRQHTFNPPALAGNIENFIGGVQIPVGLAGPILVKGMYTDGYVGVPIATTEGALVASISRGARLCAMAGGVRVHVLHQAMVRAPLFFCKSMDGAINLANWIRTNEKEIRFKAESVSSIAKLTKIETFIHGKGVHLTLYFSTGDASGQNMSTACSYNVCEWISSVVSEDESIQFERYMIEGMHSGDKKVNYRNFLQGRGVAVVAEAKIPKRYCERFLRCTPALIVRSWQESELAASRMGMMGCNINFANVIAGIFAATGQDLASIHESSIGVLKFYLDGEDLEVSAYLPSLVIGTVGGGTGLPTQREGLEMMNCQGEHALFRLAEIIAATCLSLDLSTGAAIASNEFVGAHERLGRNRPTNGLARTELNETFFTNMFHDKTKLCTAYEQLEIDAASGITSNILNDGRKNLTGFFRYILETSSPSQSKFSQPCVLKLKRSSAEIVDAGIGIARLSGDPQLPGLFETNRNLFGFEHGDIREIELLRSFPREILKYCPMFFGDKVDTSRQIYAMLMEDLTGFPCLNAVEHPEKWRERSIDTVLRSLAEVHSCYLGKTEQLPSTAHVSTAFEADFADSGFFLETLLDVNISSYRELFTEKTVQAARSFLGNFAQSLQTMAQSRTTLTHNDCNPRNMCLRSIHNGEQLVLFDWELACVQNPEHDVVEFLAFIAPTENPVPFMKAGCEVYRKALAHSAGTDVSDSQYKEILLLNALHLLTVRFGLYILVNNIVKHNFIKNVTHNLCQFIEALSE